MEAVLFYVTAAVAAVGALGVVLAREIVHMAVYLLLALLGVAGLYVILSAEFLAAVQLVVYVGGTLTLIIFGVMLTARATTSTLTIRRSERLIVYVGGALLAGAIAVSVAGHLRDARSASTGPAPVTDASPLALGRALLGDYVLAFELASLLLLAAMIGAAYVARRRREPTAPRGSAA